MRFLKQFAVFAFLLAFSSMFAFSVLAVDGQSPEENCDVEGDLIGINCVSQGGLVGENGPEDLRIVVVRLINVSLGFLGIVATLVILWAGFKWMTAGGSSEEVDKARKIIFAAVVGLLIIMISWALTRFVLTQLYNATTGQTYGNGLTF